MRPKRRPHPEASVKSSETRTLDPQALVELRAMLAPGYDVEEVIISMRNKGFSKIDSMKFLRDFASITLHDAKHIVHLSPAWADRYESDEAFHDAAEEAAKIIFSEEHTAA